MLFTAETRVLEMQNFNPPYMKEWTYVRAPYGRFCRNQNFFDA